MNPINPLYLNGSVTCIEEFTTSEICEAYQNQLDFDVSRFFKEVDLVKLYECKTTGYRFFHPFTTVGDAKFYKDLSLHRKNYYSERWNTCKL